MMEFFRASESLLYPLASTHAINMYQLEHICFDWEISFENQIWCYFSTHSWLFFLCWLWITTESLTFSFLLWSKIMLGIWFRSLIVYILWWIKFHDRLVTVKHPYMPEHIHYWIQYNSGRSMKSWLCFTELYINVLAGLRQAVLWFQLSRGSMDPIWSVEGGWDIEREWLVGGLATTTALLSALTPRALLLGRPHRPDQEPKGMWAPLPRFGRKGHVCYGSFCYDLMFGWT
jgi:hypothetical protein